MLRSHGTGQLLENADVSVLTLGSRSAIARMSRISPDLYRWIGGREKLTVRYQLFLIEIPEGFRGVSDLQAGGGEITITERDTGKTLSLKSAGTP